MDLALSARASRFLEVCVAAFSLEIITMGCLVYVFYGYARILYPFASILANIPRAGIAVIFVSLAPWDIHETGPGREMYASVVGPWLLRWWCVYSFMLGVLYLIYMFHLVAMGLARDQFFLYALAVLATFNLLITMYSSCLLSTPPAGTPGIAVKTFEYQREAGPESAPRFGANCCICLSDIDKGELVGQLPCRHLFHAACIRQWLAREGRCPMRCAAPQGALEASAHAAVRPAGGGR